MRVVTLKVYGRGAARKLAKIAWVAVFGQRVDDVAAEVDVEFARSVALQCVKVLLFEDVWFKVT